MSVYTWARKKLTLTNPEGWAFWGGENYSGKRVDVDSALTLSAVMACVRLIAETISTLPVMIYERQKDGSRVLVRDYPLFSVLHDSPNADQTAVEFWEGEIAKVALVGNAVSLKTMRNDGSLISLEPLAPTDVSWRIDPDRGPLYAINDRGKIEQNIPSSEVFHIKGFGMDRYCGLSPISYARHSLGTAMAADETAGRFLGRGMNLSGFIKTGGAVLDEANGQRKQWAETLKTYQGSENAGKLLTLEGGFDFVPMSMPAKDAQLLESRRFSVEEACRWFRTFPILIGHSSEGQTMWGTGVEQIMLAWLTTGLRTFIVRIEAAANKRLIVPADRARFYCEINVDGLLRADSTARAALYSSMIQNAGMKPNEMRSKENLPLDPNGNDLLVQSSIVRLKDLGNEASAANSLKTALRAFLVDDATDKGRAA